MVGEGLGTCSSALLVLHESGVFARAVEYNGFLCSRLGLWLLVTCDAARWNFSINANSDVGFQWGSPNAILPALHESEQLYIQYPRCFEWSWSLKIELFAPIPLL